jgi:antitoxin FitA-like protein
MPVTLTIKNVPDELAEHLRALAAAHHRSLQGELMAIIESVGRLHDAGKARSESRTLLPPSRSGEASPGQVPSTPDQAGSDGLLAELDAIVAGSQWGEAPILSRSQANDRALTREFGYQIEEEASRYKR